MNQEQERQPYTTKLTMSHRIVLLLWRPKGSLKLSKWGGDMIVFCFTSGVFMWYNKSTELETGGNLWNNSPNKESRELSTRFWYIRKSDDRDQSGRFDKTWEIVECWGLNWKLVPLSVVIKVRNFKGEICLRRGRRK